jgi:diacylglycerol O-acyltransferase
MAVREETSRLKGSERPAGFEQLIRLGQLIPPLLRSRFARAFAAPRVFNLTISQSPIPRGPIQLFGCELQSVFSVVPIVDRHALAVGLVRYRQELFFGCYADPCALPDVYDLPALLSDEIRALGGDRGRRPSLA